MNDETSFLRNHWSLVASNLVKIAMAMVLMVLISATSGNDVTVIVYMAIGIAMCIVTAVYSIIVWRKTQYYFLENEIVVKRATIFRLEVRIQYERLASVNVQRDFICRMLGTTKLSFNLNSSVNVNKAEAYIVLPQEQAEELRSDLYDRMFRATHGMTGAPAEIEAEIDSARHSVTPLEDAEPLVDVTTGDIIMHSMFGMPTAQALIGILMLVYSVVSFVYGGQVSFFAILIFGVEFFLPAFGSFLKYYGYRIVRVGDTVSISSGLISTRSDSFKLSKVNFVKVREPLFCRLMGKVILEVEVVGTANEKGLPLLCPLKKKEIAMQLFHDLLPEFECKEMQHDQCNTCLPGIFMWMAVTLAVSGFIYWVLTFDTPQEYRIFAELFMGFMVFMTVLWGVLTYRNRKFSMNDSIILAVTGSYDRLSNYILLDKVQFAEVKSTPIQRRKGDGRCEINMLSALGAVKVKTGVFKADVLEKVSSESLARIRDGRYDFRKYQ